MTNASIYEPATSTLGTNIAPDLLYWVNLQLEAGAQLLLIDLCQVETIDSSGIGTLMIVRNRVRRAGAKLSLCSLNSQTLAELERAGLTDKFEVYANRDEFETFLPTDDF
ncbi:MAG: STAS domain-containing protein [Synechococcales bacterium]|nr:STAS domain-containing protein [Synechococcales bacterium]